MSNSRRRRLRRKEKPKSKEKFTEFYAGEESRLVEKRKKPVNWYVKFCRRAGRMFKAKNSFKDPKYTSALDFLGWDLQPREVNAAPIFMLLISLILAIPALFFLIYLALFTYDLPLLLLMYIAPVLIIGPIVVSMFIQRYLLSAAKSEKMRSITFIPEIVNYLVMSMKLSSNLERAVDFAAEHGRGRVADELKKLRWDVQIGTIKTIEEGLDALAYKWGTFSDEFKHALMLIRSSVIEIDEAKRNAILDKAVTDTLEGIKDDMSKYATEMRQPSIYLYYVGVLLPLMLIIMLPIGSMMARLPLAQTWVLFALYNVAIPIGTIFFAKNILQKRPPVYVPPKIPDTYPGLPRKGHIKIGKTLVPAALVAIFLGITVYLGSAYILEPMLNPVPPSWNVEALATHFPFFQLAGMVMGIVVAISIYLYGTSFAKRKVQKEMMELEKEFQDSIYVIASRLGENRPIEEAIAYTSNFLSTTKISGMFRRTDENIRNLGMTVEGALFDPTYGSLKHVHSDLIHGAMRIVTDSINLGVQQAARALISLSLQLRDAQKIKETVRSLLEEITSMMKSIAFFIAPLVLGITSALQKIIIGALQAVGQTPVSAAGATAVVPGISIPNLPFTSIGDASMLQNVPSASTFLLLIALYVIEVTIILIYFTSRIEEGDNNLALKINIARSLPIAIFLFFIAAWFASMFTVIG